MYTIKTLNAISPVGLAKLNNKQFDVAVDTDAPDGILVRSADMLNTAFNDNLLAIARAGAGVNNIPLDRCSEQGIVVFNTPGANANAVAELVIGMLMDAISAILICVPIFMPICTALGIDPIHFGVLMTCNLAIGFVTPPVGVNLFVASSMTGIPVLKIARSSARFIAWFFAALMMITFVPQISLLLLGG